MCVYICMCICRCNTSKASFGWPKGKAEAGESDAACAIREVYEETGFNIRCLRPHTLVA